MSLGRLSPHFKLKIEGSLEFEGLDVVPGWAASDLGYAHGFLLLPALLLHEASEDADTALPMGAEVKVKEFAVANVENVVVYGLLGDLHHPVDLCLRWDAVRSVDGPDIGILAGSLGVEGGPDRHDVNDVANGLVPVALLRPPLERALVLGDGLALVAHLGQLLHPPDEGEVGLYLGDADGKVLPQSPDP
eukprot:CAMPEP_0168615150 /NCGR_PEP_ID=MMETSP0449_2-20121227/4355_1 /TAXON_ID=1082188 /ORGANISM="Strombidium rassoulzadegani, Strain ras09" /LENGTH=189 /DNA_ID=CAMNT_0008655879 /DNA_START=13 /DNA_END=582 /DNA_ORIENTATION=+